MVEDFLKDGKERMEKSIHALEDHLAKIRTGRAHPSIVQHITVEYYGSEVPLNQVANIAVEDARTLSIVPWEKSMVAPIEKAIMNSDLGITPTTAGDNIRLPMPPLTEERRRELVKVARHEAEQARVAIRNIRRDINNDLKALNKDKEISDDELRRAEERVQKLTDDFVAKVDALLDEKEKALMEV